MQVLKCPECGVDSTHLEGAKTDLGGNGDRLDALLLFSCEEGHIFTLRFHQHKGLTYVERSVREESFSLERFTVREVWNDFRKTIDVVKTALGL